MDRKLANRKLIRGLLIMTAGSFAFGWALDPAVRSCSASVAGIGNAGGQGRASRGVQEAVDPNREITVEFVATPASVGSYRVPARGGLDARASGQAVRHRVLCART